MSLVYQVSSENAMKNAKVLIAILIALHAVLSIVQGFDLIKTLDLAITILLAFLVIKSDKEE